MFFAINTGTECKFSFLDILSSQGYDGVPLDAVGPGEGFHIQPLPDFDCSGIQYVEVFVSNIDTPSRFWLQLRGRSTTDQLEELMDQLE